MKGDNLRTFVLITLNRARFLMVVFFFFFPLLTFLARLSKLVYQGRIEEHRHCIFIDRRTSSRGELLGVN